MKNKGLILILIALVLVVIGFVLIREKAEAPAPESQTPTTTNVPESAENVVMTPNGHSFTLPAGWDLGAWTERNHGRLSAGLITQTGMEIGVVTCPSLGKYERYGMVSGPMQKRSLAKEGTTFDVTLQTDASEHRPEVLIEADVLVWPMGLNWNDAANRIDERYTRVCSVFVELGEHASVADVEVIYNSWQ